MQVSTRGTARHHRGCSRDQEQDNISFTLVNQVTKRTNHTSAQIRHKRVCKNQKNVFTVQGQWQQYAEDRWRTGEAGGEHGSRQQRVPERTAEEQQRDNQVPFSLKQRLGDGYSYIRRMVYYPQTVFANRREIVLDGRFLLIYGPYAGPHRIPAGGTFVGYEVARPAHRQLASKYQPCHLPPSPIIFGNHLTHQAMHQCVDNAIILPMSCPPRTLCHGAQSFTVQGQQ